MFLFVHRRMAANQKLLPMKWVRVHLRFKGVYVVGQMDSVWSHAWHLLFEDLQNVLCLLSIKTSCSLLSEASPLFSVGFSFLTLKLLFHSFQATCFSSFSCPWEADELFYVPENDVWFETLWALVLVEKVYYVCICLQMFSVYQCTRVGRTFS